MDLAQTYDKIAGEWHKDHKNDDWWIGSTDAFVSFLKPGYTVLDAGCGAGTKSKYLQNKGLKVTGIDFSEKMIEIAKKEVPEAEFFVMDMKEAHKLKKMFDGIFMQASLLHIPKKEVPGVIENMAKNNIKPGGYIYIAVKEIRPGRPEEEIKAEDDYGYKYERFFSYFTAGEIKDFLNKSGLEIAYEDIKGTGRTNWIQIIGKKS